MLTYIALADPLPFESENGEKEMDEAFLKLLKESTTGTTKGEKGKSQLHKLNLEENNVAKVCAVHFVLLLFCIMSHAYNQ